MNKKRLIPALCLVALILLFSALLVTQNSSKKTITSEEELISQNTSYIAKLHTTIETLDQSLGQAQEPKSAYSDYLRIVRDISADCTALLATQINDIALTNEATNLAERSTKVCQQMVKISNYSQGQFTAVGPAFSVPSSPKNYQNFPVLKSINARRLSLHLNKADTQLKAFNVEDELDNQTTILLKKAIEVKLNKTAKTQLTVNDIREVQQQLIAVRVEYWKSFVGLNDLQNEMKNQLSANCTYINSQYSQQPAHCRG